MYVTIVDENDNAPKFQQPHYEVSLDEGPDTINASLITVQAQDPDEGPNGTVTYAIVAGNIINTFRINRHTVSSDGRWGVWSVASQGRGTKLESGEELEPALWAGQRIS